MTTKIKHLVIAGGGPTLIQSLGAIQQLEKDNFIHMNDIESIYGTSAGALVGVMLCLKFDWETINDYIIKRPWKDVFPLKVQNIFDAYTKRGIYDEKVFEKCLKPLFDAKDISINMSLTELYEYSKIELHFFAFEINHFETVDISYLTYPNISVLTACQMTCGLPILVTPIIIENKCFIDGGVVYNYPLKCCLDMKKNEKEIIGFKNQYDTNDKNQIDSNSTLLDFVMTFLFKVIQSLSTDNIQPKITNEVCYNTDYVGIDMLKEALTSVQKREQLLQNGREAAKTFLESKKMEENGIKEQCSKIQEEYP